MHELGITQSIVAIVREHAMGKKVTRVKLEVGKFSAIMPGAILFCYDVCCKGTELEDSTLEIVEIPGKAYCNECNDEIELNDLLTTCHCGSRNINLISGDELNIKEMEVA